MAKAWKNQIGHVQPGEPVSASVVGRPNRALEARTNNLQDRLNALEGGQALIDFDAAISIDVLEGQPVYWSAERQRYEQALAGMELVANVPVATPASDCCGIVLNKRSAKVADIVLFGLVQIPAITNAIGSTITPGRYFLSGVQAGKLVAQRPAVSVPVALVFGPRDNCDENPLVLVLPQLRDFQHDHVHLRLPLTCRPAGTHVPQLGVDHTITDADDTLLGWLPADHASFAGTAPPGAVFGYNLAADTALSRCWPPIPIGGAALLFDRGEGDHTGATEVPLGRDGLAVINRYGIWWMSNCYGDVPWPTTYDSTSSVSVDSSESSLPECPRTEQMRLDISYVRSTLGAANGVVTDLSPADGSPITVTNCDGDPASTGSLRLGLALSALIESDTEEGSLVFKALSETGFKFKRGRVTEGIRAGSANVSITSTVPKTVSGVTTHQGIVTIDANLNLDERELPVQIARLEDAVEREFRDVPYLGLPAARDSRVTFRFDVPTLGIPETPLIKFRATLFGTATGTLPPLTLEYKRIARPDGFATPSAIPAAWIATPPAFDAAQAVTANEAIEIESDELEVAAGDTVIVQLSRDADSGYDGEVGSLKFKGVLIGG
jgi:hypothetical protein